MAVMVRQPMESMGRLLVVEGDLLQRTVIGKIGEKLGYDTLIASSFEAAAAHLRQESFDIMTLDLSLGERDGVELLRLVADLGIRSMPIVIISSCDERILNSARRVAEGLKLSINGCITKPLNLERLKEALYLPRRTGIVAKKNPPSNDLTRERIAAGLAKGEFLVEFQPKVDLGSGKFVGISGSSKDNRYADAEKAIENLQKAGRLKETTIHDFAVAGEMPQVIAGIAALTSSKIDVIAEIMTGIRYDALLVPCKAAGLDWLTVETILRSPLRSRPASSEVLNLAKSDYQRLSVQTAQKTLRFLQVRATVN